MKKSAAVREILATGITNNKEIQKQVKAKYGLEVGYQTVYALLKANGKSTSAKTPKKMSGNNIAHFEAGIQLIKIAGGIDQARAVLQTIEAIRRLSR